MRVRDMDSESERPSQKHESKREAEQGTLEGDSNTENDLEKPNELESS